MNEIAPHPIQCPYCWETIEIYIDCSVPSQEYIEDCQVCCRPMNLTIHVDDEGTIDVGVYSDND